MFCFLLQAIDGLNGQKPDSRCQDALLVKKAFKKQRTKRYPDVPGLEEFEVVMNKNTNNVYFRGLPNAMSEEELLQLCQRYGEVTAKRLREPGVAFVRFVQTLNLSFVFFTSVCNLWDLLFIF